MAYSVDDLIELLGGRAGLKPSDIGDGASAYLRDPETRAQLSALSGDDTDFFDPEQQIDALRRQGRGRLAVNDLNTAGFRQGSNAPAYEQDPVSGQVRRFDSDLTFDPLDTAAMAEHYAFSDASPYKQSGISAPAPVSGLGWGQDEADKLVRNGVPTISTPAPASPLAGAAPMTLEEPDESPALAAMKKKAKR